MGFINRFDLNFFISQFGCRYFVETGTGQGISLKHAASHLGFKTCFSCEIMEELFHKIQPLTADPRIVIEQASSETFLRNLLPRLDGQVPCLFWLDAHFPGADFGLRKFWEEKDEQIRLPLEREMQIIRDARPEGQDVILMDDLRIYENGRFENGNVPPEANTLPSSARNIQFIYRIFGDTHRIIRCYWDEGYVILLPRKKRAALALWSVVWPKKKVTRTLKRWAREGICSSSWWSRLPVG